MREHAQHRRRRPLLLLGLLTLLCAHAHAQVSFVQITDPHVFDDFRDKFDNRLDDKAALASVVAKINQKSVDEGISYDFVVVTGDLGIEQLLSVPVEKDATGKEVKTKEAEARKAEAIDARIRSGAAEIASVLARSKVRRWLFVPGNNDVANEEQEKVRYYHRFLEALADEIRQTEDDFKVIDLCPKDPSPVGVPYDSQAKLYQIPEKPDYAFIGFDNTTFKNAPRENETDASRRIVSNSELQQRHVKQVVSLLSGPGFKYAYVFYHIPEVDDPHLATMGDQQESVKKRGADDQLMGGRYERSAWFVTKEVREAWQKQVVVNPKVYGLFAGHFHDPQQKTYRNFDWMTTPIAYPSVSLSKLHVCPPLALKFQNDSGGLARGFQEVYIDTAGAVSTRVFWLEQAGWRPVSEVAAAEEASLRQFELGRTYEGQGRFKEAEAAYLKAAESNWQPTRQRALASLSKVVACQDSPYEKYFIAPLGAASYVGATAFFTALPTFLFLLLIYLWLRRRGKRKGKYQLKIGPIITSPQDETGTGFEQVAKAVHGRIRTHYSGLPPIFPPEPRLPMLANSLCEEVASLVESSLPSVTGKLMAWLIRRTDRPWYSIEGVMYSNALQNGSTFTLYLMRKGEPLQSWNDGATVNDLIGRHRYVAFEALIRLVREVNR